MNKDQLKAALIARYGTQLNKLTPKALEALVDKLATRVESEDKLEDFLNGLENGPLTIVDFAELATSEADRRTREARTNLEKKYNFTPKSPETPAPATAPEGGPQSTQEDIQAQIQAGINAALKPFMEKLGTVQLESKRGELKAALKAAGIDESWADDVTITDSTEITAVVTSLKSKWDKASQAAVNAALADGRVLQGSGEMTDSVIKEFAKDITPKDAGYNVHEI